MKSLAAATIEEVVDFFCDEKITQEILLKDLQKAKVIREDQTVNVVAYLCWQIKEIVT